MGAILTVVYRSSYGHTAKVAKALASGTTLKRWFTLAWKDKIAAGFTNSGSYSGNKLASLQQVTKRLA